MRIEAYGVRTERYCDDCVAIPIVRTADGSLKCPECGAEYDE